MSAPHIQVQQLPNRGRGLVATRLIKAGEVVLAEDPILLTPSRQMANVVCSNCLRGLAPGAEVICTSCHLASFCSQPCASAARTRPEVHSRWMCSCMASAPSHAKWLLQGGAAGADGEAADALHFLLQALALRASAAADPVSAQRYAALLALTAGDEAQHGGSAAAAAAAAKGYVSESTASLAQMLLHTAGPDACQGLSQQEVQGLVSREARNSFGVMAPSGPDGERRIRGSAIYPLAAMVNHDCLPNVARFDYFDGAVPPEMQQHAAAAAAAAATGGLTNGNGDALANGGGGTVNGGVGVVRSGTAALYLRALHDIPAGEEVTMSYFPLHWRYSERQARCAEQYGFTCTCLRCQEESTWPSDDEEEDGDEAMASDDGGSDVHVEEEDAGAWPSSSYGQQQQGAEAIEVEAEAAAAGGGGGGGGGLEGGEGGQGSAGGQVRVDEAYISVFLMKYICPREGCLGSLAPLPGAADVSECNLCGGMRTDAEFMAELEG